jgi:predicted small lipoprotein YifL
MCTNTLSYLQRKLKFKSILLTFVATIFLSACGIKGDLYQTPEQAVTPKDKVVAQRDEGQKAGINKSVESQEQTSQPPTEQATIPLVKQPIAQVKEQQ